MLGAVYVAESDEVWVGGAGYPTTCNGAVVPALTDRPLTSPGALPLILKPLVPLSIARSRLAAKPDAAPNTT